MVIHISICKLVQKHCPFFDKTFIGFIFQEKCISSHEKINDCYTKWPTCTWWGQTCWDISASCNIYWSTEWVNAPSGITLHSIKWIWTWQIESMVSFLATVQSSNFPRLSMYRFWKGESFHSKTLSYNMHNAHFSWSLQQQAFLKNRKVPGLFSLECFKGIAYWFLPLLLFATSLFLMCLSNEASPFLPVLMATFIHPLLISK